MTLWCYSQDLSFEENIRRGAQAPLLMSDTVEHFRPRLFLDKLLAGPLGVAQCPATSSSGIRYLSNKGYSYFTYQTIRSREHVSHLRPNYFWLKHVPVLSDALIKDEIEVTISRQPTQTMTHSFGMPCLSPTWHAEDIALAKTYLNDYQALAVSCYGEGQDMAYAERDWLNVVAIAREVGADFIELNLQPDDNRQQDSLFYYADADFIRIITAIIKVAQGVPVIAKIPYVQDKPFLANRMLQMASHGIRGVSAIGSLPVRLLHQGRHVFGMQRLRSALSGEAIYGFTRAYLSTLQTINRVHQLELALIASGGINSPHRIQETLNLGVDLVTSATAVMRDPFWAKRYIEELKDANRTETATDREIAGYQSC